MAEYIKRDQTTDALLNNTSLEGYDLEEAVNMLSRDDARELLETIEDAPTIIPEEEGE